MRCDAWPHYRTSQVFSGFVDHLKQDGKLKTQYLYRFEAASLQDMVTKFEPNLGFEKSFISVLALKVCLHVRSVMLTNQIILKNRAELQKMRTFYKLDFDADMDEEVLR